MNRCLRFGFLVLGFIFLLPRWARAAEPFRTMTSSDGRQIEARVLSVDGEMATIEKRDGSEFDVPFSRFSEADRVYLKNWRPALAGPTAEELNALLGVKLFTDDDLWDDRDVEVAARLGWPQESRTATQASFRNYPRTALSFLGAHPFSQVLYGVGGKVESLSLVFANRGDSLGLLGNSAGMDDLNDAIEHDADAIRASLSKLLGEEQRQSYGEGAAYRRVSRWDWRGHAFLLSEEKEQYVGLQIEPSAKADLKGRPDRARDSEIRESVLANVQRKPNGDVLIANIPMVDQGPKGYCVPATFERCMRYYGIPSDMYLLAVAGHTQAGGGTLMDVFVRNVRRDITRHGRSLDDPRVDMEIRDIARFIDRGMPLLWLLTSTPEFNLIADKESSERARVKNWRDWPESLSEFEELGEKLVKHSGYAHISMIVGYNARTGEVAVSDSWGLDYEVRWILAELAEKVSIDFYVIGI